MKLSVFTVMAPDFEPEELIEELKQQGFDGVEWRYKDIPVELMKEPISFWGNNKCTLTPEISEEQINQLKSKSETANIETVSITPYLTSGDLAGTEQVLKVAKAFGASFIRLGVPRYDRSENFHTSFESCKRYLKECEALCKSYGVKGLVETHHQTIAASASAAYRLVQDLDPEAIGVLYDPGNMVHEGYENHRMGMELLGPYLAHVHVKNAKWVQDSASKKWKVVWELVDEGIVDWEQVIEDLQAVHYEGYIGLEDFSGKKDTKEILQYNIDWLKSRL
ncbi:sugar phosphate isomerase/epimerase family protein [Gracilibacillus lacisalsi]|uniref:sugar phosphate isomerase/epimerase family protein n=1 Tax=Gracilibacillus lacisalsi TaxID=393087 RepID=UPI0003601786|nr:sugar phosphate isomerase/epimerase family protein [Gracilibacillus lacisalsi]